MPTAAGFLACLISQDKTWQENFHLLKQFVLVSWPSFTWSLQSFLAQPDPGATGTCPAPLPTCSGCHFELSLDPRAPTRAPGLPQPHFTAD